VAEAEEKKKRVPLLSGLIGEGLKIGVDALSQLTDEQAKKIKSELLEGGRNLKENLLKLSELIPDTESRERLLTAVNELESRLKQLEEAGEKGEIETVLLIAVGLVGIVYGISVLILYHLRDWLLSTFVPKGPVTYEDGLKNAYKFLDLLTTINSISSALDTIGHIEILGTKLTPFSAIARTITNISWTFGIGWLTWIVMGPPLRYSIADPMERHLRYVTRSEDLPRTTLEDIWLKEIISEDRVREELAKLGYSDEKIDWILENAKRLLSATELRYLYKYGKIDIMDLQDGIRKLGYRDRNLESKVEYERLQAVRSALEEWLNKLEYDYKYGYIDPQKLIDAYDYVGYSEEEKNIKLWSAEADFLRELRDDYVKGLIEQYRNGVISEDVLRDELMKYIARPEKVESIIFYEKSKKMPSVRPLDLRTIEDKIRSTQSALERYRRQEKYYLDRIEEEKEYYSAKIDYVKRQYESRIEEEKEKFDAWLEAVQEEFNAYRDKTVEELEARIKYLQEEMSKAKPEDRWKYETKIELLTALAQARVEERARVYEARIEREKRELDARIKRLQEEMSARIRLYEEERDRKLLYYQYLLDKTRIYIQEYQEDLQALLEAKSRLEEKR